MLDTQLCPCCRRPIADVGIADVIRHMPCGEKTRAILLHIAASRGRSSYASLVEKFYPSAFNKRTGARQGGGVTIMLRHAKKHLDRAGLELEHIPRQGYALRWRESGLLA